MLSGAERSRNICVIGFSDVFANFGIWRRPFDYGSHSAARQGDNLNNCEIFQRSCLRIYSNIKP
jgi:hypothetical protein